MSLTMLHDYVLIKAHDAEEETKGGIVLAPSAIEAPAKGVVISAGPGKFDRNGNRIDHGIQEGDQVIFSESALNQPIEHDGEKLHIMLAEQIFGVDK